MRKTPLLRTAPTEAADASLPLTDHIKPFLDRCRIEKGLARSSTAAYTRLLATFADWLASRGLTQITPAELTADHVWAWRVHLADERTAPGGKPLSATTQSYYLIALRSLLDYLAVAGIPCLSSAQIPLPKLAEPAVAFLEPHEIEALLASPDTTKPAGLRDRAILETLYSTGLRLAELVALDTTRLSGLDHLTSGGSLELSITGKGKVVRTVFLSPRACTWLKTHLAARRDNHPALFVALHGSSASRFAPRSLQAMIRRTALAAGLSKAVTPHTLRHSFATTLLAHGADLRSVQEMLGHKNVATTQVYTHVTNKQLRDIHTRYLGSPL